MPHNISEYNFAYNEGGLFNFVWNNMFSNNQGNNNNSCYKNGSSNHGGGGQYYQGQQQHRQYQHHQQIQSFRNGKGGPTAGNNQAVDFNQIQRGKG